MNGMENVFIVSFSRSYFKKNFSKKFEKKNELKLKEKGFVKETKRKHRKRGKFQMLG